MVSVLGSNEEQLDGSMRVPTTPSLQLLSAMTLKPNGGTNDLVALCGLWRRLSARIPTTQTLKTTQAIHPLTLQLTPRNNFLHIPLPPLFPNLGAQPLNVSGVSDRFVSPPPSTATPPLNQHLIATSPPFRLATRLQRPAAAHPHLAPAAVYPVGDIRPSPGAGDGDIPDLGRLDEGVYDIGGMDIGGMDMEEEVKEAYEIVKQIIDVLDVLVEGMEICGGGEYI
ncbi:hypothetical protein R3P38DRAFT_3177012 [Favolaschia claudopus]|uniref:Uncharacterized protein n=1 Tax=Favolaschia claudopus TaxID=2862362 RepID=A0AAW0D217_9AGAR